MQAATTTTTQELRIPQITIGVRMKLARETAGLKQSELAEAIGIATRSVQNYELGNTTPKRPVLLSWALATGVPLAWLIEGEIDPPPCPECGHHGEPEGNMEIRCSPGFALVSDPEAVPTPAKRPSLTLVAST